MKTLRFYGITLLIVLCAAIFTACSENEDNEILSPVDNTLELLIGTWQGTGEEEGSSFTFNSDGTYTDQDGEYNKKGTFEYFPNRYMFVTYYHDNYGDENIIYTVVNITNDTLILNNNGHSDITTFKRKK